MAILNERDIENDAIFAYNFEYHDIISLQVRCTSLLLYNYPCLSVYCEINFNKLSRAIISLALI